MSLDPGHDSDRGHDRQRPQPGHATPWDPAVHYRIVHSETGPSDDGYWQGEPKYLECEACGARVRLFWPEGLEALLQKYGKTRLYTKNAHLLDGIGRSDSPTIAKLRAMLHRHGRGLEQEILLYEAL